MSQRDTHEMKVGFIAKGDRGEAETLEVRIPDGDLKPWDLDTKFRTVGTDVDRIDGLAKATGAAKYTFDINLPGMLHGAILRSTIANGEVKSIDTSKAEAMPGVRAVLPLKGQGRRGRVRFVGDAIAAIAADTLNLALDALEAIEVEYESSDHAVTFAGAENAPATENGEVTEEWPSRGEARMQEALDESTHTETGTWWCEVQTHSALEPHGHVCRWNEDDQSLDVWASSQATFVVRMALARQVGIPQNKIHVHAPYVGGGFGAKFTPGVEGAACAILSQQTKKPVKLMLDRYEEHVSVGNRPSALMQIRAGINKENYVNAFDYRCYGGPGFRKGPGKTKFPRHYLEEAHVRETQIEVITDTDLGRAMRAPGFPQGYFAAEGMMDALAEKAGMDPLAFRLHNDPDTLRRAEWRDGAEAFGWAKRWQPYGKRDLGQRYLRGAGLASAFWGQLGGPGRGAPHKVLCRIHPDGSVESRNGAQDIGTGMKTVLAILTAEELQIEPTRVAVTMGETSDPSGPASGGSTTTPSLAPAARLAAGLARQRLRELVADHLGADVESVDVRDGRWGVEGGKSLSFADACKLIGPNPIECVGERFKNYNAYKKNVCGCQFAEVEVDTRTGIVRATELLAVQDCGVVIAKKLAESQVIGAMIGGMSYALHEQRIMDRKSGRMLNGDMMMYKIAGSQDMPKMTAHMVSVANGANNVGAAGLGEPPSVATPAAIANAVGNAIGAPVRSIPITPDKVLAAIRAGGNR